MRKSNSYWPPRYHLGPNFTVDADIVHSLSRRDLISMLSLSGAEQVSNHPELFSSVLDLLTYQLRFVEVDFFEVFL